MATRQRFMASGVHFALSALVLAPVLVAVFVFWYPAPWFEVQGAAGVVAVLIGVQILAGPLLTALVFRPGKKGLVFDLVVIAVLQLMALGWGTWVMHDERPRYVVFAVDRFVPLAGKDVNVGAAGMEAFDRAGTGAPVYAFAEMPMGAAFQALQDSVLFGGGPDLERRPEYWRSFEGLGGAVLQAARPLGELRAQRPDRDGALAEAALALGLDPEDTPFLPVVGKRRDFAALLDPRSARVLDVVPVDPWIGRR